MDGKVSTPPTPIDAAKSARKKTDRAAARRRQMAVETTYRETEYIDWLSKNRIPVIVKLVDDETVHGWIEYYDRDVIRLTCAGGSNLFVYKDRIKYLYEDTTNFMHRRSQLNIP